MAETLGEKLRQAREERGISISEVAEQTRISPLYIESIEKDDYSPLPGGIFNKGFVKSFAKYVGIDEQEALADYSKLIAATQPEIQNPDEPKTYRPQVLTDDRSSVSNLPTIIFAIVILALMTWGVLALVNYIQKSPDEPATNTTTNQNANAVSNINAPNANTANSTSVAANNFKVEIKAVKSAVSLSSTIDGESDERLLKTDDTETFEPKESLRLKYSQSKVRNVQMTINGKVITLPKDNGRRPIEFEIKQSDFQSVLDSGQVSENFLIKKK